MAVHERTVRHAILAHDDARQNPPARRIAYRGQHAWLGDDDLKRFTALGAVVDESAGEVLVAPMISGTPAYADQAAGVTAPIPLADVVPGAEPLGVVPAVVVDPVTVVGVDAHSGDSIPAEQVPAVDDPSRPPKVAPKADWEAFAVANGLPESDATDMTKADLIELYSD